MMNPKLRQVFRWSSIVACCCLSGYVFLPILFRPADTLSSGSFAFLVVWMTALASVPLGVAYAIYRRNYDLVWNLFSSICAIAIYFLLAALPQQLGFYEHALNEEPDSWLTVLGLPIAILIIIGPFFAAHWVFKGMMRIQDRYFSHGN